MLVSGATSQISMQLHACTLELPSVQIQVSTCSQKQNFGSPPKRCQPGPNRIHHAAKGPGRPAARGGVGERTNPVVTVGTQPPGGGPPVKRAELRVFLGGQTAEQLKPPSHGVFGVRAAAQTF